MDAITYAVRVVAVISWMLFASRAHAVQDADPQPLSAQEIAAAHKDSVVTLRWIDAMEGQQTGFGTAFLIGSRMLVTNYHVAAGDAARYGIPLLETTDGQLLNISEARVAWFSEEADLVVISLPRSYNFATKDGERYRPFGIPSNEVGTLYPPSLSVSVTPELGSRVVVIGSPRGLQSTVSEGILSGIRLDDYGEKVIQISAAISPGSSGSPVLDEYGNVFAVATSQMRDGQLLNFAVPLSRLSQEWEIDGPLLSDWANEEVTSSEADFAEANYRMAVKLVLPELRDRLEKAEQAGDDWVELPSKWPTETKRLRLIVHGIQDELPGRLGPDDESAPSGHWLRSAILLTPSSRDSLFEYAHLAASVGTDNPRVLKFCADLLGGINYLELKRKALLARPSDEAIAWSLCKDLIQVSLRQCDSASREIDPKMIEEDPRRAALWARLNLDFLDKIRLQIGEATLGLKELRSQNPRWGRLPTYWHQMFMCAIVDGDLELAKQMASLRGECTDGTVTWLVLAHQNPDYLKLAFRLGLWSETLTINDAQNLLRSLYQTARDLERGTGRSRLYVMGLHSEAKQLLEFIEEKDPAFLGLDDCRKQVEQMARWKELP